MHNCQRAPFTASLIAIGSTHITIDVYISLVITHLNVTQWTLQVVTNQDNQWASEPSPRQYDQ